MGDSRTATRSFWNTKRRPPFNAALRLVENAAADPPLSGSCRPILPLWIATIFYAAEASCDQLELAHHADSPANQAFISLILLTLWSSGKDE